MNKRLETAVMAALSGLALAANAQDNNPPGDGPPPGDGGSCHHRPPPLPLITALDTNQDRVIDSNEIANASAALLALDKNGDGVLTTDEFLPPQPADAPKDAPQPPSPLIVKVLDANGDGVIDADEIANASAVLKSLDKNGDGKLTLDELVGQRPPMRGGRPGGPPPGEGDDTMPPGDES